MKSGFDFKEGVAFAVVEVECDFGGVGAVAAAVGTPELFL
jgi:hypothetical protein